ncbi:McrB family protein [Moraxella boevrei]|uniref:McrB family protein n=1 Tax=Faucicola boevrei TaxID=346665 RepID=UPI003736DCB1
MKDLLSQLNLPKNPTDTPVNLILTGVAGTGKTYLLQQLAKQHYTQTIEPMDKQILLNRLVEPLKWQEVICLIFLQQKQQQKELLKVNEIVSHVFFMAKINLLQRKDALEQTAWGALQKFSNPHSKTVKQKNRASQAFFDKDAGSHWFLLDESLPLLNDLQGKLDDYQHAIRQQRQIVQKNYTFVSFHQDYSYNEFVEGIRPVNDNGQMSYAVAKGAFLQLCERAKDNPNQRFAILIDEINRANVSRVFGELMSMIEPSKRAGQRDELVVNLAYSHQAFSVPSNVDIFATMNTQDHSLAPLDMAFRRRFYFMECEPNCKILDKILVENQSIDLPVLLNNLNQKISQTLGKNSRLGHSFFLNVNDLATLADRFITSILPQVSESCQHNGAMLQQIFGQDLIKISQNSLSNSNGLPYNSMFSANQDFEIQADVLFNIAFYQSI